MANIQEVFLQIEDKKKEQKNLKKIYREALDRHFEYNEIVNKMKALREGKKRIETAIQAELKAEIEKIDRLKTDMESDRVMLSDMALNSLVKGESIEIKDKFDNKYEPVIKVSFKKAG